jgi:hypothetical protein
MHVNGKSTIAYFKTLNRHNKPQQSYAITRPTFEHGNSETETLSDAIRLSWKQSQIKHCDQLYRTVRYLHTIPCNIQHFTTPAVKNRATLLRLAQCVKNYVTELHNGNASCMQLQSSRTQRPCWVRLPLAAGECKNNSLQQVTAAWFQISSPHRTQSSTHVEVPR